MDSKQRAIALIVGVALFILFKYEYVPWVIDTLCDQKVLIESECKQPLAQNDKQER
jgi:hypothetical protein